MAGEFTIRVNTGELKASLSKFAQKVSRRAMLEIAGNVMVVSVHQTFRDEGVPAGSWPPLAASTLKRKGPGSRMLIGVHKKRAGGILFKSIAYEVKEDEGKVYIGSNLVYAGIQHLGGVAGRKPPFKKKGGRRPVIPARPYLVFRPEDPQRLQAAEDGFIQRAIGEAGL